MRSMEEERLIPRQEEEEFKFFDFGEWAEDEWFMKANWIFFPEGTKEKSEIERGREESFHSYSGRRVDFLREFRMEMRLFWLFIEYFFMDTRIPLKELMNSLERNIIVKTLNNVHGNQKKASRVLGVKHTTLNEKIKKYRIHPRKMPF
jgi:transcriptional regulator with AAA-type ATPase domain